MTTSMATAPKTGVSNLAHLYPLSVPRDYNGYVVVAKPALRVQACDVQVGDILILDSYISRVSGSRSVVVDGNPNWHAIHIGGDFNIIRFPHEILSVIRPDAPQES